MQNRLITGLIVVFLALAIQDGFLSNKTLYSSSNYSESKSSALLITTNPAPILRLEARVVRVIDGDTVLVTLNGTQEKIRLIGVDAPEFFDPRGLVQCSGEEASSYMKSQLENQVVQLEADVSQGNHDKYGRLLRYVFLEDGTHINEKIIAEGYGHEYTYSLPYRYQAKFKKSERSAQDNKKNLWANGTCGMENTL